jgi:ribosomal subunit interface protein
VDIIFTARHTDVLERFRTYASGKLAKIEKLDSKTIRIDVEVSAERNPRQAHSKERVELTVISRGPAIRAEAAAEDRFAAFDLALGKLESRLRRACDRRKDRHGAHAAIRLSDLPEADLSSDAELPAIRLGAGGGLLASNAAAATAAMAAAADAADAAESAEPDNGTSGSKLAEDDTSGGKVTANTEIMADTESERLVEIEMQGEGPLVVREKFHAATPMAIDQALFEMELVGHDFFLFTDAASGLPSVVYRRRGYHYGVIRLTEDHASAAGAAGGPAAAGRRNHNGSAVSRAPGPDEAQARQQARVNRA